MLVVLPHGPEHPRQGRQEAAIDGRQRHERRLFGPRQVGLELRTEGGQDCLHQCRVDTEAASLSAPSEVRRMPNWACTCAKVVICCRPRKLVTVGLKKYKSSKVAY